MLHSMNRLNHKVQLRRQCPLPLYTWGVSLSLAAIMILLSRCTESISTELISYNTHIRPILSDKCFKCHGPDEKKRISGYRLDTEAGAYSVLKDQVGKYGIVPSHPELSDAMRRVLSTDPDYMMPPPESNLKLTEEEKKLIEKWIAQGAQYEKHWSFVPLKASKVPTAGGDWAHNEIDHFIYASLEKQDLKPEKVEYDAALLRRMYHDITGIPPSIADQEKYEKSPNKQSYEAMLDQALASKHYGEKMAILWMDISRYADSHGYQDDGYRTMWPWRDWVIHAFNKNYDYKKFVSWQLAGDLIPDGNKETLLATGFNRNHKITQEGGVIDEEYRIEYVTDRTNTFGKGLLGMTFECAKCHDHKYDPITQKDYFSAFAFFNNVDEKGLFGDISVASLADPPYMTITKEDKEGILSFVSKLDTGMVNVMIMKDSSCLRTTHILDRGAYDKPAALVDPATPKSIFGFEKYTDKPNRLGLSEWMFDLENPLTSRVFVNLIWQEFFGMGIVKTSGDFGLQGDAPSHPELLDWLAYDFMSHNWDIKRLVKQIAMSATYMQQNHVDKAKYVVDPENVYLSRGPRIKLSAELMKDHILATSGLLNPEIGGPSVKPYQPKGLWEGATSGRGQLAVYVEDKGKKRYRRGLYHIIKRTVPPPSMLIFDGANRDQCEVKRPSTNTPLQSLVLMNDYQVLEASRHLAREVVKQSGSPDDKIKTLFRRIVCRVPSSTEVKKITNFHLLTEKNLDVKKAKELLTFSGEAPDDKAMVPVAAMMQTIQLLYNLEETSIR
jgi:hypothetical protein